MKTINPAQRRFLLPILILTGISLVAIFIIGITSQGKSTGGAIKGTESPGNNTASFTSQSADTSNNCTAMVLAPEYSPKHFYPPSIIVYDSRPFLVTWPVVNTSEDCVWSTLQLLSMVNGQLKTLNLMPPDHSLPAIDAEFAIWDKNDLPMSQVNPRQRVTISIQINGLDLVSSNGKIDRSFDLIVNGQLAAGGKLIAQQSQWVVVHLPSETPTITYTPSKTPTITSTPTVTPTNTASPTRTPYLIVLPTRTPTEVILPPRFPTNTPIVVLPTTQPPTVAPPDTPTVEPPPADTPTLPNP